MSWIRELQCCVCEKLRLLNFNRVYAHHAGQTGHRTKSGRQNLHSALLATPRPGQLNFDSHAGQKILDGLRTGPGGLIREYNERYEAETGRVAA